MPQMVLGIFPDRDKAEKAIDSLQSMGFNPKDISIMMKDTSEAKDVAKDTGSNVAGGAVSGATTGGVIGALAGLLVGIGAIAIPGIGALLIGGPIAAALGLSGAAATTASGAVTGILAGGIVGALVNLGVPENEAREYETRIKEGGILLAVPANSDTNQPEQVRQVMDDNGAEQINTVNASF
jgi:uncharacterized membrane protein